MPTKLALPLLVVLLDKHSDSGGYGDYAAEKFTWQNGRQLATASATVGDTTVDLAYTYDINGLRTSKTITRTVETAYHEYIYASGKLLREVITTTDAEGNTTTETLDFTYDASGSPFSLTYNGTTYYYVVNLQGDVIWLVSGTGATVAEYEYDPYGQVSATNSTLAKDNPLRYRGYYYDAETEFYYLQSRYYDPTICRFINADALASTGQGFLGQNMFAYCLNSPTRYTDSQGCYPKEALKYEIFYDEGCAKAKVSGSYTVDLYYGKIETSFEFEIILVDMPSDENFYVTFEGDLLIVTMGNLSLEFKINEHGDRLGETAWLFNSTEITLLEINGDTLSVNSLTGDFTYTHNMDMDAISGSVSITLDADTRMYWLNKMTDWTDRLPKFPIAAAGGNFQGNNGGIGGGGPGGCWGIRDFCSYKM